MLLFVFLRVIDGQFGDLVPREAREYCSAKVPGRRVDQNQPERMDHCMATVTTGLTWPATDNSKGTSKAGLIPDGTTTLTW